MVFEAYNHGGTEVSLQRLKDSQWRNRPRGYAPHGETINAHWKESDNGRQGREEGQEQGSETKGDQARAADPEEAGEATEEPSVTGIRIRAREDPTS
jgi:hypothetical protein